MDEILLGWVFLLGLILWRKLAQAEAVQRGLERLRLQLLLQWYMIGSIVLGIALLRTFYDIVKYEYIGFDFLTSPRIEDNIMLYCANQNLTTGDCINLQVELTLFDGLRWACLAGPVFGLVAFFILSCKLADFVLENKRMFGRWELNKRLDWVVIIIGTPLVFIVMTMRSLIRVLAVMTGSCWTRREADDHLMTELELSTYQLDLELAVTFQYFAVWMFGELCTTFLQKSHCRFSRTNSTGERGEQNMRILARLSLQGIYIFVVIGTFRTLVNFAMTELHIYVDKYLRGSRREMDSIFDILSHVSSSVSTLFVFVTALCITNVYLISDVEDLKRGLASEHARCFRTTTSKFLGTRLLLIFTEIQPQIVKVLTNDSPLHKAVYKNREAFPQIAGFLEAFSLSKLQTKLLHASLLNFECLLVVILTWYSWPTNHVREVLLMDEDAIHDAASDSESSRPFLDASDST